MNLSEFVLNLILVSLLTMLAVNFSTRLIFHLEHLQRQIQLEDTALKALLTLQNSLKESRLSYCSPYSNKLINLTQDAALGTLDLNQAYLSLAKENAIVKLWGLQKSGGGAMVQSPLLITYNVGPVLYLMDNVSVAQDVLLVHENTSVITVNELLFLDDCEHRMLVQVASVSGSAHTKTIKLKMAIPDRLKAPIALMPVHIEAYYIGRNVMTEAEGLYRYDQKERVWLYPFIKTIQVDTKSIQIEAKNAEQLQVFKKAL